MPDGLKCKLDVLPIYNYYLPIIFKLFYDPLDKTGHKASPRQISSLGKPDFHRGTVLANVKGLYTKVYLKYWSCSSWIMFTTSLDRLPGASGGRLHPFNGVNVLQELFVTHIDF